MPATEATTETDFHYVAFISYSGTGDVDGESTIEKKVAQKLVHILETYRPPAKLLRDSKTVPKKLGRCFRDHDELRATKDLEESLKEALRNTKWLIVLCSPRARQSSWVNREVNYFKSLGRGEFILPVLVSGDPRTSFPEALWSEGVEPMPLAPNLADAKSSRASRASNDRRILRKLDSEALRLIATMLGVQYDELRQRENEREAKRVRSVVIGLSGLVCVLTALSMGLFFQHKVAQENYSVAMEGWEKVINNVIAKDRDEWTPHDLILLRNGQEMLQTISTRDPSDSRVPDLLKAILLFLPELEKELSKLKVIQKFQDELNHAISGDRQPLQSAPAVTSAMEANLAKVRSLALDASVRTLENWNPRPGTTLKLVIPNQAARELSKQRLATLETSLGISAHRQLANEYTCAVTRYCTELLYMSEQSDREEAVRLMETALSMWEGAASKEPLDPLEIRASSALRRKLKEVR